MQITILSKNGPNYMKTVFEDKKNKTYSLFND